MTVSFSGMVATIGLPSPWGIMSSGSVVVRAHGTQTSQDTQTYTVNFAPLVPASGSVTAYLAATITTIQQTPMPVPGPPPGHPAYNPNTVPTVVYAQQLYTTALTAVTGGIDNVNTFELFRTTLTASQSTLSAYNTGYQQRAANRQALPSLFLASGGTLTPAQAQLVLYPTAAGLTHTLPPASGANGLPFTFVNLTNGNETVATTSTDVIWGMSGGAPTSSVVIAPSGSVTFWALGASNPGSYAALAFSPSTLLTASNTWTGGTNTFNGSVVVGTNLTVDGSETIDGNLTVDGSVFVAGAGGLTVSNNAAVDGVLYLGSSGAFYINPNSGGTQLIEFGSGNYIQYTGGTGIAIVSGGSLILYDSGGGSNFTMSGNLFTANNAGLRAAFGAFGSGDSARCVVLNDFVLSGNSGGWYERLPNGLIIQGAQALTPGTNDYSVTYPIAFPTALLVVVGCAVNSTAAYGAVAAFGSLTGFGAHMNTPCNMEYIAIGY